MPISREHTRLNPATNQHLQAAMASQAFQQCWARPFRVDYTRSVPQTSSYSDDGAVYYIDKDFYAAVKSGQVVVPNMTPSQIIQAAVVQDRTEKCLIDSGQDGEPAAHELARLAEFNFVRKCGSTPKAFQAGIQKVVQRNLAKQSAPPPAAPPAQQVISPPAPQQDDLHQHIKALAESQKQTNEHLRNLGTAIAARPPTDAGVAAPPAPTQAPPISGRPPEPAAPSKKKKGKRRVKLHHDADGNLIADVEYDDEKKSKRQVKLSRDADGNLIADEISQ